MKRLLGFPVLMAISMLIIFSIFGCGAKEKTFHIGVLQWTEKIDAFTQTYKGVIDGLVNKGLKQGINLKIDYRNVEQDKDLALTAARGFVKNGVDLIVAIGTGSSLAALEATEQKRIPIVFSNSGAPKAADLIKN